MVSGSACVAEAWRLGGLHDRAGGESGLMAACAALMALEMATVDQTVLMACAVRTAEAIGPAGFLQSSLTFILTAIEPLELSQVDAFLELDRAVGFSLTVFPVSLYVSASLGAEQAG